MAVLRASIRWEVVGSMLGNRGILVIAILVAAAALLAFTLAFPKQTAESQLQVIAATLFAVALSFGIHRATMKGRQSARARWDAGLRGVAERLGLRYRGLDARAPDDWPRLIGSYRGFMVHLFLNTDGDGPLQTMVMVQLPGLSQAALAALKRMHIRRVRVSVESGSRAAAALEGSAQVEAALRALAGRVAAVEVDHSQVLVVVPVSHKGWDPTYGMETDPERICSVVEALLEVAEPLSTLTS
jgi:hypothetical protein